MKLSALVLIAFLVQACQPTSPSTSLNAESADLETTIVSLERAQSLFDDMASRPEIPFKYTASGCQYRSHRMGWLLEQEGVISTQVYVYGGLKDPATGFGWQYHVAPMVLVSSNDGPHPMVIDPSTALGPLSPEDWVALFSEKPLAQLLVHYTSRFVQSPNSLPLPPIDPGKWQVDDLANAGIEGEGWPANLESSNVTASLSGSMIFGDDTLRASVVSEATAHQLFADLLPLKGMSLEAATPDEDAIRTKRTAHRIAWQLERRGLTALKVFVYGKNLADSGPDGYKENIQIGAVVLVEDGSSVEPWVLDPIGRDAAMPLQAWIDSIRPNVATSPKIIKHFEFGRRFAFSPRANGNMLPGNGFRPPVDPGRWIQEELDETLQRLGYLSTLLNSAQ